MERNRKSDNPRVSLQSRISFLTVVPSELDLLKQKHDTTDDGPRVLVIRGLCSLLYLIMIAAAVFELFVKPLWHRIPARIRSTYSGGAPPETSTAHLSPATRLPLEVVEIIAAHLIHDIFSLRACALTSYSWYTAAVPHLHHTGKFGHIQNIDCPGLLHHTHTVGLLPLEVVEMIVAYLVYDPSSLCACAMTCYSWYIAAVPHLHHTLTIDTYSRAQNFEWSNPLQRNHELGLLPLVKRFRVRGSHLNHIGLSPTLFNRRILRPFLALSNVLELEVEYLDIPNFMPRIRRYFRNFMPTIRSLSLREPRGSHRQIIYFIGLFQHLQDLRLIYVGYDIWQETVDDPTLFPPFIPPLRGRLMMTHFAEMGFLKEMITLFGGIRFYQMKFINVGGMQLLLGAGAETLECVALSPIESCYCE